VRRPRLEVADIFHRHGAAWRKANTGHVSLGQLKVMSAIESCRSAALGGHLERCEDCGHSRIAYNSGFRCYRNPIVNGDGDLLALNPFREIPIVTPAAFVQGVAR
jgi:Transposase zinc-binding domain